MEVSRAMHFWKTGIELVHENCPSPCYLFNACMQTLNVDRR